MFNTSIYSIISMHRLDYVSAYTLWSNVTLGAESHNQPLLPTSMEGSYVSLGEADGVNLLSSINSLTEEMCERISTAKDELTKELQINQRDLGQANTKYKYLETRFLKMKRDYKGLMETQAQKEKEKEKV